MRPAAPEQADGQIEIELNWKERGEVRHILEWRGIGGLGIQSRTFHN